MLIKERDGESWLLKVFKNNIQLRLKIALIPAFDEALEMGNSA